MGKKKLKLIAIIYLGLTLLELWTRCGKIGLYLNSGDIYQPHFFLFTSVITNFLRKRFAD